MAGKRPSDVSVINLGTLAADDSIPIDRASVSSACKTTPANIASFIFGKIATDGMLCATGEYIVPSVVQVDGEYQVVWEIKT